MDSFTPSMTPFMPYSGGDQQYQQQQQNVSMPSWSQPVSWQEPTNYRAYFAEPTQSISQSQQMKTDLTNYYFNDVVKRGIGPESSSYDKAVYSYVMNTLDSPGAGLNGRGTELGVLFTDPKSPYYDPVFNYKMVQYQDIGDEVNILGFSKTGNPIYHRALGKYNPLLYEGGYMANPDGTRKLDSEGRPVYFAPIRQQTGYENTPAQVGFYEYDIDSGQSFYLGSGKSVFYQSPPGVDNKYIVGSVPLAGGLFMSRRTDYTDMDADAMWRRSPAYFEREMIANELSVALSKGDITQNQLSDFMYPAGGFTYEQFEATYGKTFNDWLNGKKQETLVAKERIQGIGSVDNTMMFTNDADKAYSDLMDGKITLSDVVQRGLMSPEDATLWSMMNGHKIGDYNVPTAQEEAEMKAAAMSQLKAKYPNLFKEPTQEERLATFNARTIEMLMPKSWQEAANWLPVTGTGATNALMTLLSRYGFGITAGFFETAMQAKEQGHATGRNQIYALGYKAIHEPGQSRESWVRADGKAMTSADWQAIDAVVQRNQVAPDLTPAGALEAYEKAPMWRQIIEETLLTLGLMKATGASLSALSNVTDRALLSQWQKSLMKVPKENQGAVLQVSKQLLRGVDEQAVFDNLVKASRSTTKSQSVLDQSKELLQFKRFTDSVTRYTLQQERYNTISKAFSEAAGVNVDDLEVFKPSNIKYNKVPADIKAEYQAAAQDLATTQNQVTLSLQDLEPVLQNKVLNTLSTEERIKLINMLTVEGKTARTLRTVKIHTGKAVTYEDYLPEYPLTKLEEIFMNPRNWFEKSIGSKMAQSKVGSALISIAEPRIAAMGSKINRLAATANLQMEMNGGMSNWIRNNMWRYTEGETPFLYKSLDVTKPDYGIVSNVKPLGTRPANGATIREYPDMFEFTDGPFKGMKVSQTPFWEQWQAQLEAIDSYFLKMGGKRETFVGKGQQIYAQRFYNDLKGAEQYLKTRGGFRKLTKEEGFEFERQFPDIASAMEAGLDPIMNIEEGLRLQWLSKANAATKVQFAKEVQAFGTKAPSKLTADIAAAKRNEAAAQGLYNSLTNRGKLTKAQVEWAERNAPDLAKAYTGNKPVDELKSLLNKRQQELKDVSIALKNEKTPSGTVSGIPELEGHEFPKEIKQKINSVLKGKYIPGLSEGLSATNYLNNIFKILMTGADFGVYGTYMSDIIPFNPVAGGKAVKNSIMALSESQARQIAARLAPDVLDSIRIGGITYSTPEFFELSSGKSALSKFSRKFLAPFQRNMSFALDTAKVMNWKSLYTPGMDATEAFELGRVIEQTHNLLSPARLGMSTMHKQLESSFFFYAMQYTRSGLATVGDLFAFNKSSLYAARKLGGIIASGAGTIALASYVLQAEDTNYFNPNKPILSFKKNGYWYGLGGAVLPIIDTFGDCVANIMEGNGDKVPSRIGRYFQGRSALATGLVMELFKGKNFIGNPVYGQTALDTAKLILANSVAGRATPMWTRNLWDMATGAQIQDVAPTLFAEFAGFKTRDITQFEKYTNTLDYYAQQAYKKEWEKLSVLEKKQLQDKEPAVLSAYQEYQAAQAAKKTYAGTDAQYNRGIDYGVKMNAIMNTWRSDLFTADKKRTGGGTYYEWLQESKAADKAKTNAVKALQAEYPDVVQNFGKNIDKTNMLAADIAYYDYTTKIFDGRFEMADGAYDWNGKEVFDKQWIKEWGQDNYNYIQLAMRSGKNIPNSWYQHSLDMQDIGMSGYWDLPKNKDEHGLNLAQLNFRKANPNIDAMLYMWHYVDNVQTQAASDIVRQKQFAYGMSERGVPVAMDSIAYQNTYNRLQAESENVYKSAKGYAKDITLSKFEQAARSLMTSARANEYGMSKGNPLLIEQNKDSLQNQYNQLISLYQMVQQQDTGNPHYAALLARMQLYLHEMNGRIGRISKY